MAVLTPVVSLAYDLTISLLLPAFVLITAEPA